MKESDNFFEKVYQVARLIPYGKVTTYGSIANYLGAARSARMVFPEGVLLIIPAPSIS